MGGRVQQSAQHLRWPRRAPPQHPQGNLGLVTDPQLNQLLRIPKQPPRSAPSREEHPHPKCWQKKGDVGTSPRGGGASPCSPVQ